MRTIKIDARRKVIVMNWQPIDTAPQKGRFIGAIKMACIGRNGPTFWELNIIRKTDPRFEFYEFWHTLPEPPTEAQ